MLEASDAKSGKACLTYTTDPGTSCDQIIVSNGAVWASKTCASPGIFAAGGVNCNNTYSAGTLVSASGNGTTVTFTTAVAHLLSVGQKVTITGATPGAYNLTNVSVSSVPTATTFTVTNAASGTYVSGGVLTSTVDFGAQIDSILAKATTVGGELPFPATTGVVDRSALTGAVCTPASGKIPATMTLLPGYYGGDPTSTLNKATGGGYYVKSNKTACITTSAGADQIKDVLLSPGVYYFGLSKDWVVADGYSVVGGGTPLPLATDPAGTGTSYYYCDPTNAAGVQLVFGAASSGATVNGINNSGTVTLCGQANTAAAIALGGPNTVVLRGLRNPDFSPAVSLKLNAGSGPTLYADATCTQSTSATCGLLTNAATGAFNVTGFVFAPNDSFNLNLSPDCGTDTTWELLDCEANPTIGNGGIASFMGGVVLDGMYLNIVKNGGVNSASAAAKWQGVPWVPTTGLPNPSSGVNAADIVLTATGAGFSGSAEITVTQYAPGSNVFSNLKTIAWSNG